MIAQAAWETDIRKRAKDGRVMLICGTGLTAALSNTAPYSTWDSLIRAGLDYVGGLSSEQGTAASAFKAVLASSATADSYIAVGEWLVRQFRGMEPGEYLDWLKRTVGSITMSDPTFAPVLRGDFPILTTNYDSLLEQATGRRAITWTDKYKIDEFHESYADHIFHLHGFFEDPDSVILSGSDYSQLASAKATSRVMESLAAGYTPILVGYGSGLDDPNFSQFLLWFADAYGSTVKRIYVLCKDGDLPKNRLHGKVAYLSYGNDYPKLPEYLASLLPSPQTSENLGENQPDPSEDGSTQKNPQGELDLLARLPLAVHKLAIEKIGSHESRSQAQNRMIAGISDALSNRSAALMTAVTGTGKTTISRICMNLAVADSSSAMMILPTKALVTQEAREWQEWELAWSDDRKIRVYPSSRDYPENDSPVSKGRFEISIAIYEKLSAYIISGKRTLASTSLLVVDEMQTLVGDKARAGKLEGLLTFIKLIPEDARPAIVGLSATMSSASTEILQTWLGVDKFHFVESNERPISLHTYVVEPTRWRIQKDAHLLALRQDSPAPAPVDERHTLSRQIDDWGLDTVQIKSLSTAPIAIALVCKLIKEDPTRHILVFVSGRTAAQDLAQAIQKCFDSIFDRRPRKGSPWRVGRFADPTFPRNLADEKALELLNSDLPLAGDVVRGLRTGVAYHSARLAPRLRHDLEEEFRNTDGLLRVLVATDTLAMGVNLPADAVIATSLSGYGAGGRLHLSTPAELDNKAGRAGRRGVTTRDRGEFYILVPRERDLQGVNGMTAAGSKTLSTLEGVYDQFVAGTDRTQPVSGQIRELDDVALLALQVLTADGFGRVAAALELRVEGIITSLLAAQELDSELPSSSEVIARLTKLQLLDGQIESKIRPTRLGEALARSGLLLQNSHILERVARLATDGAGDIDLLFNAFRSDEIAGVTAWVGLPSVHPRHYPSLKEKIVTYALAYLHSEKERRRFCSAYFGEERYNLPTQFVVDGQAVRSNELQRLLESDAEAIDNQDANALLRALVAFEWSRGIPFDEIKARFSAAITSDEKERNGRLVELRLHYSDVEQLCEQVAGVVRGASEISYSESHDWSSRVRMLALQTEVGLPAWLAPIAKMRIESLHRNRLAALWMETPVDSGWASILDFPVLADHVGISNDERQLAKERLERREREETLNQHQISQEWSSQLVPGLEGTNFEEFAEELAAANSGQEYSQLINELGEGIGAQTSSLPDEKGVIARWVAGGTELLFAIPDTELGETEVLHWASSDRLVILRSRMRPSAYSALASGPTVARFVQPESILSIVALLVSLRGTALHADEVVERLRAMRVSVLDSEAVSVPVDPGFGPPPFVEPMPPLPVANTLPLVEEENVD